MTTPIDVILRFVKTGQGAEQARTALKGLGAVANRADVEMSAMGATAQASQRKLSQLGDEVARGKKSVEQATREWKEYQKAISSGTIPAEKSVQSLTQSWAKFAVGLTAVVAVGKQVLDFQAENIRLAGIQEDAETQLAQTIKSTGAAAGFTATELKQMASGLQGVTKFGDEATLQGQSLLLTFTSIGKDVFPRATETMLDMSQALGQDMKSSAIQLGKALNDPITGVSALQRVGVSFTEQQKEQIKVLAESGRVMDAQNLILDELSKQFGGSAAAAAETYSGKMEQLGNAAGDLREQLGFLLRLTGEQADGTKGVVEGLTSFLALQNRLNKEVEEGNITSIERAKIMNVVANTTVTAAEVLERYAQADIAAEQAAQALNTRVHDFNQAARDQAVLAGIARDEIRAWHRGMSEAAGTNEEFNDKLLQGDNLLSDEAAALVRSQQEVDALSKAALAGASAEVRWNEAMKNSNDLLAESKQVAAAAAAARAKLAAATGDLFTEFSEADGALKFFNESLDELGQQYVAVGGRSAEQSADLEALQSAYDKAEGTIRDYELGIKGANLTDEQRADKIAEQQQAMAGLAANMQPLLGIQSELVSVNNALSVNQDAVNSAMYAAADAADADAAQLAILKLATGELTPVQAEAAIKSVVLEQTLKNLGQAYADGDLTLQGYISAAQQAVQDINSMTVEFDEQTGAVSTANAEAAALIDTLGLLPTHHDFVIKITQEGEVPTLPQGPSNAQTAAALAEGGPVPAGPPISGYGADNVMIAAQTGEYMLKRSAVNKLGLNRLNYMNSTGRLPGFAEGGLIGNDGGSGAGASIMFQPVIQVTGVVSRQQGIESGRNILDGLVDAARGRGVRI